MRLQKLIIPALMVFIAVIVLALQSYNVGFWGLRHGWTSSHGLAIMTKAEPDNGFVGYSMGFYKPDGSVDYVYFDRYPFIFSVTTNLLLHLTDDMPTQVYIARQYMNVIFLATMFAAYFLVSLFIRSRVLALAAVLLAFSSFYLLYYKDMIHYDQPALFGMILLAYAIAHYRQTGNARRVLIVALIAVILGRGYASFFMLGVWFLMEAVDVLRRPGTPIAARFGQALRHPALWITVMSVIWSACWLGYNIVTEARIRGVDITETSIVDSALRRIPLVEAGIREQARVNVANTGGSTWFTFLGLQLERTTSWSLPLRFGRELGYAYEPEVGPPGISPLLIIIGLGMIALLIVYITRLDAARRGAAIVAAGGGWLWLVVMINLSATHEYATMYTLGFTIMVYTALLSPLDGRRWPVILAMVGALGLFGASNGMVRAEQNRELEKGAVYTYDFNNVVNAIEGEHRHIYFTYPNTCVINNWQCHALGYYLGDNYIMGSHRTDADYVVPYFPYVTSDPFVGAGETLTLWSHGLTPQNKITYLFDVNDGQPRTAPESDDPLFRFGDDLTLQSWSLDGEVTLRPCERVVIESWWLAETAPDTNYNMQIVMVNGEGAGVSEANGPLTSVQTRIWETGNFTLDARPLTVPCDTPPGEYPLIMGVYNPDTLAPLPATTGTGEGVGNQVYLTTLFIQP